MSERDLLNIQEAHKRCLLFLDALRVAGNSENDLLIDMQKSAGEMEASFGRFTAILLISIKYVTGAIVERLYGYNRTC